MNIKKIFSGIVSAVMLFSFSAQYIVRNETAMASGSKGSSTFIENEPTVIADSSVGSFIANSMKSEDITEVGEQESGIQYSGDYGIEDITYDPDANTLSLSTWQDEGCTAVVGFYSDDGKRMYTSEKVVISQGSETTTLRPYNSKLPDSFLIKAYLVNEQLMPLCNCYVYNKMTKDMQEILAKTVDDFDPSLVVQIDETDDTNNFYVLNDDTKLIDSTSDTNTIVSADYETGTYVFTNIDDSLRGLSEGDIFSAATDKGVIAAEIETITIDSDVATIVGTSDEEELFQFVKIDTSELDPSLLGAYTLDMSEADEGVSVSDKSFDETPIPEDESTDISSIEDMEKAERLYAPANIDDSLIAGPKTEEQANLSIITAEPTFTIAEKKAGASENGFSGKVNFVVSIPMEIKVEFYHSLNYSSIKFQMGLALKAKGSASFNGEFKIPLAKAVIPVAGVLHLRVTPYFVVRGSVEVSITYQHGISTGYTWETDTLAIQKCDGLKPKIEDSIELNLKASFFMGLELDFEGYIVSKKTCSITFPLDMGLSVEATLPIASAKYTDAFESGQTLEEAVLAFQDTTDEFPDALYNCDVFVEIDTDFLVSLSAELKVADYKWNPFRDKWKIKADIFEERFSLGKSYYVLYHDKATGEIKGDFGLWDDLADKDYVRYKASVKVYDKNRKPFMGASVNYDSAEKDVITGKSGEVLYYLPPGQYAFTCCKDEESHSKYTEIINTGRTVSFIMGDHTYDPDDLTDPRNIDAQESLKYLSWEENSEDGITITSCKRSAEKIVIPREIEGKPVTSIRERAFEYCQNLTSVTLPKTVTSIGYAAFYECIKLETINIPDSVTSIGGWAFYNCKSLTDINIPYGVTSIEDFTFNFCYNLKTITVPDSVTSIGVNAFEGCSSLTDINIPDGVNYIDFHTFACCFSLTDIKIPDSVGDINEAAFNCCTSLTDIRIPSSVSFVGKSAFMGCTSLTNIEVDEKNEYYSSLNGVLYDKDKTALICWPAGLNSTAVTIPDSVTTIEYGAFEACGSLTDITIPGSVTNIGQVAFGGCKNLASVTILNPDCQIYDSVTTICNGEGSNAGEYRFDGTIYGYANSTAQEYAEKYGYRFEPIAPALEKLSVETLMSAMKTAENTAEVECSFKQEVPAAGIYNFYVFADENAADLLAADNLLYMTQVQVASDALSVEIPYILGSDYPNKMEKLVRFESADNGFVFDDTQENDTISLIDYTGSASDITIPDSVASIGSGAFEGCTILRDITIPSSVTTIGESAFAGCENLVSVTILNPDCQIYDSSTTLFNGYDNETGEYRFNGTIYGYTDSTAQAYAEKYGYKFEAIGSSTPEKYKFGDPNGNGKIDSSDASFVLGVYAILATGGDAGLEEEQIKAADVNRDGKIDSKDASIMLSYYSYTSTGGKDDLETFLKS